MKARVPNGMGKGPSNNMNQMLKQAQKMQDQITALQADLEQREFKGTAGGGGSAGYGKGCIQCCC